MQLISSDRVWRGYSKKLSSIRGIVLFLSLQWFFAPVVASPVIIPDPEKHNAFLYGDWQSSRANLLVFIDPLCPYCKKAIPKLENIRNYNVFVYWSPIFGEQSERVIDPLFRCDKPTSNSLLSRFLVGGNIGVNSIRCDGVYDHRLRAVNNEIVDSYNIDSVPAFYLQGVRVSLSRVLASQTDVAKFINGVAVDWRRYKDSKVIERVNSRSLAVILSSDIGLEFSQTVIEKYKPEYLFLTNNRKALCEQVSVLMCRGGGEVSFSQLNQYEEITSLLGLSVEYDRGYLVTRDGRITRLEP